MRMQCCTYLLSQNLILLVVNTVPLLQLILYVVAISIRNNANIVRKYLILIVFIDNNINQHAYMHVLCIPTVQ